MAGFCNVPDQVATEANRQLCHWPVGMPVRWSVERAPAGWSIQDWEQITDAGFQAWNAVCGSRFQRANRGEPINVLVTTRRIDGPGGVLAEAELPCGRVTERTMLTVWADEGDRFVLATNPPPGHIDALGVMTHEFGHTAGIGHAPQNEEAIMAAIYRAGMRRLHNWDVAQAVMRYGATSTPATPPPKPPAATDTPADMLASVAEIAAGLLRADGAIRDWVNGRMGG